MSRKYSDYDLPTRAETRKPLNAIACPIEGCKEPVSETEMGMRSHLRKHIRLKDITEEQMRKILFSKFPKTQTFGIRY